MNRHIHLTSILHSLFNLTATFLLIERCKVVKGRFGCCCDVGDDNSNIHFVIQKSPGDNKRFLLLTDPIHFIQVHLSPGY